MADLYLHSLVEFSEIIFPLLETLRPRTILEIGSETGAFTEKLHAYCDNHGARLTTIEPQPTAELIARAESRDDFLLAVDLSVHFMEHNDFEAEFAFIDGDHNYYTVMSELCLLHASWVRHSTSGVALLHDVGWPCARRDFYYAPATIPKQHLLDYTFHQGVTLGSSQTIEGGLRGEGQFAVALCEGGEKNGVLTAVEDFLKLHPEYVYFQIDAVLGLGGIAQRGTPQAAAVEAAFAPYQHSLIRRLEQNRMALYLKVIELQDLMNKQPRSRKDAR